MPPSPQSLQDLLVAAGHEVLESYECQGCGAFFPAWALFSQPAGIRCGQCMLAVARADEPEPVYDIEAFRVERRLRLIACDETQYADRPESLRALWAPYREALRQAPEVASAQVENGEIASLADFVWPEPPGVL